MGEIALKDKINELRNIIDKTSKALNNVESELKLYKSVVNEIKKYIKQLDILENTVDDYLISDLVKEDLVSILAKIGE